MKVLTQHEADAALREVRLTERQWRILELRLGVGQRHTLEQVGEMMGITRERVRQIQKKASERLQKAWRRPSIAHAFERLERSSSSPPGTHEPYAAPGTQSATHRVAVESLQRLQLATRALCHVAEPDFQERWPSWTFRASLADPPVRSHAAVAAYLETSRVELAESAREWTYVELALIVLRNRGKPWHWRDIAIAAERLAPRRNFSLNGCYNALIADERFARVGPGTYGLVEWGLKSVLSYPDLIASFLGSTKEPSTVGEIGLEVQRQRAVKWSSLQMFLDLHPRFYRSLDERYGLRVWLMETHQQTLRTPPGLVEAAASRTRLERAAVRGLDLEKLLSQDR